eukprot:TRINITY_DN34603_c0_g1_i1.p1 TRINITY_DN34603_c0_g1~~TRINITY_DN34603_c0_g1_i1.p1  ORF type:complete len:499 (-),score=69.61 TRINITY_DN34603_c0_g1_i1:23-1519(-)
MRWAVAVLTLSGSAKWAVTMTTSGILPDADRFLIYVGRFCFDYTEKKDQVAGRFTVTVDGKVLEGLPDEMQMSEGPPCWGPCETQGKLYFMVFDDEEGHWGKARAKWETITCEEMLHDASFAMELSPLDGSFNRSVDVIETTRPRFWYFTMAACGVEATFPVTYEIHAENVQQGYQSEFSLDEKGGLTAQLCGAFLFLALAHMLRLVARQATGAEALRSRPLSRLLIISTLCSAASASSLALHFAVYMLDGAGLWVLEVFGQIMICCAKGCLTLLVLLVARGWALFYIPEQMNRSKLLLLLWVGVLVISIGCEIHAYVFSDRSTALSVYETWPGFVLLVLNVFLFLGAWCAMRDTYRHETSEEVRIFYLMVAFASVFYFLTLPFVSILAGVSEPWVRAIYVERVELLTRFCTTLIMSICLRPTRLDAMVNARLEVGLGTVGEPRDSEDDEDEGYDDGLGFKGGSDDDESRQHLLSPQKDFSREADVDRRRAVELTAAE